MNLAQPVKSYVRYHGRALRDATACIPMLVTFPGSVALHSVMLVLTPIAVPAAMVWVLHKDTRSAVDTVRRVRRSQKGPWVARVVARARSRQEVFPGARVYRAIVKAAELRRRDDLRRLRSGRPE